MMKENNELDQAFNDAHAKIQEKFDIQPLMRADVNKGVNMTAEEKLLISLLHLSINHNSRVMELATNFVGNMNSRENIRRAHKAFKEVHKSYYDGYEELVASLEKELIDEAKNTPAE